ncbi:MAG TPA: META domain-containing protein [Candidatus Acidoferrum sp.]|nr:META domain-containing protein [Candidatus Acidoferrum sp.]
MMFANAKYVVLFLSIFVAACSSHKTMSHSPATSAKTPASLLGTEWLLTDLPGTPVVPNSKASLSFFEPGRAAGNASCNRFAGSVAISGDSIKFGQMASTRMACVDDAVGAQEDQYLKLLEAAKRFELKDNSLLIFVDGSDKPLRFARQTTSHP